MGLVTAVVASAVLTVGASVYQAEQQKKTAKKESKKRDQAAAAADAKAERIHRATRPDDESLSGTEFGSASSDDERLGSVSDFLKPKNSALGTTGKSGLNI